MRNRELQYQAEPSKPAKIALEKCGTISKPYLNNSDGDILFSLIRCPNKMSVGVHV